MSALGNLVVNIALETAAFTKGVEKSSYEAQRFAQDLDRTLNRSLSMVTEGFKGFAAGALGAVGVTLSVSAALAKLNETFLQLDKLAKDSQRFGVPVEELSKLQFAAKLSGVETDKLGDALKDLLKNAADAASGVQGPKEAFDALGVSVSGLDGRVKPASRLIEELAGQFSRLPDGAIKSNAAMKVFGESGLALIPMLNAGEEGIRKLNSEAERFGAVVTTDAAKAAELYNDNLARLTTQVDGLFISVGSSLLPALNDAVQAFSDANAAAGGFMATIESIRSFKIGNLISQNLTGETLRERQVDLRQEVNRLEAAQKRGELSDSFIAKGLNGLSIIKFADTTNDLAAARGELALVTKALADSEGEHTTEVSKGVEAQAALSKQQEEFLQRMKEVYGASAAAAEGAKLAAAARKQQLDVDRQYAELMREIGQRNQSYDSLVEYLDQHDEYLKAKEQETLALQRELEEIGLSDYALASLRASRLRETAALKESTAAKEADAFAAEKLRKEAEELRRQADLGLQIFDAQQGQKAVDDRVASQTQANKVIVDDFLDLFKDVSARSGKQFADDLKRSLQVEFRSYVLRIAVQGSLGVDNSGQATGGGILGAIGQKSISDAISSGFTSIAGSLFGSASAYAATVPGLTSAAAGSQAALLAAQTGTFGAAGTAATAAAGGSAAAGFASSALAAAPYIAAAAFIVTSLRSKKISASSLDPSALKPITDATQQGFNDLLNALGGTGSAQFYIGGNTGRQGQNPNFNLGAISGGRTIFNSNQTDEGAADGLFLSGEIALNEANIADQTTRAIVAALKLSDFADNIDEVIASLDPFNSSLAQLNLGLQNAQSLAAINEAFADAEGAFRTLSGASLGTVSSLLALTGGIEGLQAGYSAFYESFFTEEEKFERLTKQVTEAFAQFGKQVPTTRDGLRDLIDGLNLQDSAQQALFATVLQFSPAIDSLVRKAEDDAQRIADSIKSIFSGVDSEVQRLRGELLGNAASDQALSIFNTTISAARGGDEAAIAKLPDVSRLYEEFVAQNSSSAIELARARGFLIESLQSVPRALPTIPAFEKGGDYSGGWAMVGEAGPELINFNRGGRVFSNPQSSRMLDMQGMSNSIASLASELRQMRADSRAEQQAMTLHLSGIKRIFQRVAPDDSVSVRLEQ